MKGLIGFGVLGLIVIVVLQTYNAYEMNRDHGQWFGIAYDKPDKSGDMKIHVVVSQGIWMKPDPAAVPKDGPIDYNGWIKDHFELIDANGTRIHLRRQTNSKLISSREAMNVEFFLEGKVKPGTSYTFDYFPSVAKTESYRYEFTAPTAAQEMAREQFDLQ